MQKLFQVIDSNIIMQCSNNEKIEVNISDTSLTEQDYSLCGAIRLSPIRPIIMSPSIEGETLVYFLEGEISVYFSLLICLSCGLCAFSVSLKVYSLKERQSRQSQRVFVIWTPGIGVGYAELKVGLTL